MFTYTQDLLLVNSGQIYCPFLGGERWKVRCGIEERPCALIWKLTAKAVLRVKILQNSGSDLWTWFEWFPKWFHCNLHIFKDLFYGIWIHNLEMVFWLLTFVLVGSQALKELPNIKWRE